MVGIDGEEGGGGDAGSFVEVGAGFVILGNGVCSLGRRGIVLGGVTEGLSSFDCVNEYVSYVLID